MRLLIILVVFFTSLYLDFTTAAFVDRVKRSNCVDRDCSCRQESSWIVCVDTTKESLADLLKSLPSKERSRQLSLRGNGLTELPDDFWNHTRFFESIDLSGNSLEELVVEDENADLRKLNISGNSLTSANLAHILEQLPSLELLDLSHNRIATLGPSPPKVVIKTHIILDDNPINCAKSDQKWFLQLVNKFPLIISENSKCDSGPLPLMSVSDAAKTTCSICDCFGSRFVTTVNCSGLGLKSLPEILPPQTKVVDLGNNEIRELTFTSDWNSVIYLFLRNNTIESLRGLEGNPPLHSLRSLQLDKNRLTEVDAHLLKHLSVDSIFLKDNPWKCDCNAIAFQLWIQEQVSRVPDLEDIQCAAHPTPGVRNGVDADIPTTTSSNSVVNPKLTRKTIYKILKSDLCPQPNGGNSRDKFLDYLSIILGSLTIVILAKTAYDWWWQKRTGKLPQFFKLNI